MSTSEPDATEEGFGSPSGAAEKSTRRLPTRSTVNTAVIFAAALVTVIGFIVTIIGFVLANTGPSPASGAPPTGQPPSTGTESQEPAPAGAAAAEPGIGPGSCADAGGTAVTCDGPHAYEAVEMSADCSSSALMAYLGGDEGIDVLGPGVGSSVVQIDGSTTCAVTAPAGGTLVSTARESLRSSAGDAWRWCLSQENDTSISCSTSHDREVIGPTGTQTGALNCAARADRYLEVPLRNHDRQLYVTSEQVDGAQRCIVGVRGDNRLTASLRRLRSSSLPITAS